MSIRNKKTNKKSTTRTISNSSKLAVRAHFLELRKRATICALAVLAGASFAYGVQHQIIDILLIPSGGQEFIYTSPMGGINFLLSISLRFGFILATPIIVYHLLAFLSPLMQQVTRKFIIWMSIAMFAVAIMGILFGYYIGLPAALNFLLHQFHSVQIKPLITIQSYMSFVSLYLFGSALMFQLPLIILIINRIKPLKPSMLLKYERHLIVGALLVAFMMNPSPNILDQLFVVVPIILMYQLSIIMIWYMARKRHNSSSKVRHAKAAKIVQKKNKRGSKTAQTSPQPLMRGIEELLPSTKTATVTTPPAVQRPQVDPMMRPITRPVVARSSPQPQRRLVQ